MRGKHYKRKENRYREIAEELAVATSAGLLVRLIEVIIRWLLKQ